MSPFLESKKASYKMHRAVSQGAGITLVNTGNIYRATFDCAKRIAGVMGERGLRDMGDDYIESIPHYDIASGDMQKVLLKLSTVNSVAMVEYMADEKGGRFVCIWKIDKKVAEVSTNVDDY